MNSGILPLPLTLILKISLKEHIPVLAKKKKQNNNNKKFAWNISLQGEEEDQPSTWRAELLSHPRQLHSKNGIFWAGCAEERLVPGTAVEDSLIQSGFYLKGRKKRRSLVLQELPVHTEHTHAYLKLWVGNTSRFRRAVVQVLNFKCVLQLLMAVRGTEHKALKLSVCLNAALNRDDFNMCLCSPELDLYCRARTFSINNVAYIRSLWNCLGSWMLKMNFIPCTFIKSKSFTLLIHTNWHRKIGPSIWLSQCIEMFPLLNTLPRRMLQ